MPLGVNIFSADPAIAQQATRRWLAMFVLPLVLFAWVVVWQYRVTPTVQPLNGHAVWWEPLGQVDFTPDYLQRLALQPADFAAAHWEPAQSPWVVPAQAQSQGQKFRVWLRITVPESLAEPLEGEGRVGLMLNRVMCSGPWSAWAQGKLLQTNRADWTLQWNTPLRLELPVGVRDLYLGLPVMADEGFAHGSMWVGSAGDVALAAQDRAFWLTGLPSAAAIVALLLAVTTLPMTLQHRRDPVYLLFTANALVWGVTNLQYLYDITGNPGQSTWFGMAMDLSVNWNVMLTLLFAFELLPHRLPRVTGFVLLYASLSSPVAVLMKAFDAYSLVGNHVVNAFVFFLGMLVYAHQLLKAPSREGWVLLVVMLGSLAAGVHTVAYVSNMSHPDHVHTFPWAVVGAFVAFLYVLSRRSALAVQTVEQHQITLQDQLAEQKTQLQAQHAQIADLELRQQLASQRDHFMQELHDGLGSNLTSALFQARQGGLSQQDTVLLLQELAQELRQLSATEPQAASVGDVLADLRQRIQKRLAQGGIQLHWQVAINLPGLAQLGGHAGPQLRALLNEALANAIKHARARTIAVAAEVRGHILRLSVVDDGHGFDPTGHTPGRGLPGMATRARAAGWQLTIQSAPGKGCQWVLEISF